MTGKIVAAESDHVLWITIDNPGRLNALTSHMWKDLAEILAAAGQSETLRCIVIEGEGPRAFSSGADISEFGTTRSNLAQLVDFHENCVGACLSAITDCDVPVVAKIRGNCMGGGLEIAVACDLRLADETARFGAPVGKLGFSLAFAETQGLYNLVGRGVSAELLLEGRILDAQEAHSRGLITRVSIPSSLDADVGVAVSSICQSGIWAARSHKRQLRRLDRDSTPVSKQEQIDEFAFVEIPEYQLGVRNFFSREK